MTRKQTKQCAVAESRGGAEGSDKKNVDRKKDAGGKVLALPAREATRTAIGRHSEHRLADLALSACSLHSSATNFFPV
jgi:hypothetical protein